MKCINLLLTAEKDKKYTTYRGHCTIYLRNSILIQRRTMFNTVRNNVNKPMIPYYHTKENVNMYLTDVWHLMESLHSNASVLEELCEFDKKSSIESLAKQRIFSDICGNKKYPIKTIYQTMVKNNIIEDNINFNATKNSYHNLMTFYELKTLSKFSSTQKVQVYFYQNGEDRDAIFKIHTRQKDPDAYFIIFDSETKVMIIKKGLDIKLGTLKDSASHLYPIYIKNNEIKEVYNKLNIEDYFSEKISILKPSIKKFENDVLDKEFFVMQNIFQNGSLIEKFAALNYFNKFIIVNFPNKSFNCEFIQLCEFHQPEKVININSTDFFINQLYIPNSHSKESSQQRLAKFIENLGSSQIEDLLVNSKNRHKRNPDFLDMLENTFNKTKYF